MQSKDKELLPGSEEPSIRIATPLSRLQVSLIQESLRETGWKHSDKFVGTVTPGGIRPTFKMTVFQAKAGLKRSEVVQRIQAIVGKFKEEQLEMMKTPVKGKSAKHAVAKKVIAVG